MSIESSEVECPDCGSALQVVYVTELEQVVAGWTCPECGFVASKKDRFTDSVPLEESEELVMRIEKPLSSEDVRDPLGDVQSEFRARASAQMTPDELWLLIDPDEGSVVDVMAGDHVEDSNG